MSQFDDNSFDLVFSCTVLQHIPSEKVSGVISEMIRISKCFVANIEDHQEENKVYWCREGIPQRWETNYEVIYNNQGYKPKIYDVVKLMGQTSGGANSLIYISKDGKALTIPNKESK